MEEPALELAAEGLKKQKKRRKKKKRPAHKSKMITGYIIYASEIRKDVIKKYPDRDFGFISKVVGLEWKNLPQETKAAYEKRAQEQNAKSKAIAAEAFELQKLADAAAELNSREASSSSQSLPYTVNNDPNNNNTNGASNGQVSANHQDYPTNYNDVHHNNNNSNNTLSQQQQVMQSKLNHDQYQVPVANRSNLDPNSEHFQIVQQQGIQPVATTVQYCSSSSNNNSNSNHHQLSEDNNQSNNTYASGSNSSRWAHPNSTNQNYNSPFSQQFQYQRNNIVYRKPTTVRLKPKDASTQTEPTVWLEASQQEPKKVLKFSQKFVDHLNTIRLAYH